MLKKTYFSDSLVTLLIILIGAAEVAHLYGVFFHKPLSACIPVIFGLLCLGLLGLTLFCFILGKKHGSQKAARLSVGGWLLFAVLLVSILLQALCIVAGTDGYREGDMTIETVGSFLRTNEIYQVNPLTGFSYEAGLPLRIRILCLPTLYASFCSVLGLEPYVVIRYIVPVTVLLCSYAAYYCVAVSLFGNDNHKKLIFMVTVSILFWIGSYAYGMDGFGILFAGWRGVVIRNTVLIPYAVSACLRRKYLRALMCVAAEACIVWTFYGLGACIVVVVGMILASLWKPVGRIGKGSAGC